MTERTFTCYVDGLQHTYKGFNIYHPRTFGEEAWIAVASHEDSESIWIVEGVAGLRELMRYYEEQTGYRVTINTFQAKNLVE